MKRRITYLSSLFLLNTVIGQNTLPTVDYSQIGSSTGRKPSSKNQSKEMLNNLNGLGGGSLNLNQIDQNKLMQQLDTLKKQSKEREELLQELMEQP